MTTKNPRVSIVMPTFNRSAQMRRAVASVQKQSFPDWELIIVDDASTDDTSRVVKELIAKDPRIIDGRNEKNNYPDIAKTLNKGIAMARGEFIARIDDDDYWIDDDKLKKQLAFFDGHPDYVVVGGGVVLVDPQERELSRYLKKETDGAIRRSALFANPFSHTTVMFRTDVVRRVGGYGDWQFAEDWDLWLKMGNVGRLYNFPEYFAAYTVSGENKSFVYLRPQTKMIFQFLMIHRKGYPGFVAAFLLNTMQYLYSFLPISMRRPLQSFLANLKRGAF